MTQPPVAYRNLELSDAEAAAALEQICHPSIQDSSLLLADDVAVHVDTFHDGNWVATVGGDIIGISLSWRLDFDFDEPIHRFEDVDDPRLHRADGPWLYGLDTSVHPDYRGLGVGAGFYDLRRNYVTEQQLRGIILGGMVPGYEPVQHQMSIEHYVAQVVAGERYDATLSFQLKQGFTVEGILPGYVAGNIGDGVATLLVWRP